MESNIKQYQTHSKHSEELLIVNIDLVFSSILTLHVAI